MVYSASSARTLLEGDGDGTAYLVKYLVYGAVGLLAMHLISRHGLLSARRYTPLLLAVAFVLLVLVLVPGLGVEINGARRWLGAGPLAFQPSEVMKLALVLHVGGRARRSAEARPQPARRRRAGAGRRRRRGAAHPRRARPRHGAGHLLHPRRQCWWRPACRSGSSGSWRRRGAVLVFLYALMDAERTERLTTFVNPWADAAGAGFQSVQGQIAVGSGGLFGLGPGQSVQKIFYLPEAHTDFILAVIGEELGVAGICVPAVPVRHDRVRRAADARKAPRAPTRSCSRAA